MSRLWQSLVDGARDLDRGAAVEEVLTELLTRFDIHCASDPPGHAVAELLRALLAAWREDEVDELWTSLSQNLLMGLVFTIVSIGRSYALRRAFERIRMHYAQTTPRSSEHGHLGDSDDAALGQHRSERRSSGAVKTIIPVIQVDELAAAGSFGCQHRKPRGRRMRRC